MKSLQAGTGHAVGDMTVMAFPTPVYNHHWSDSQALNAELRELCLRAERRTGQAASGLARSNVGGWHSTLDFFTWPAEPVRMLRRRLEALLLDITASVLRADVQPGQLRFQVEGWCNVVRRGQYHALHSHPNAFWSGVYYVTGNEEVEGQPMSGRLELVDPRPAASVGYSELTTLYGRFLLNPRAGQVVVFPSWLQHYVHPYQGERERISIAFNVSMAMREAGRGSAGRRPDPSDRPAPGSAAPGRSTP